MRDRIVKGWTIQRIFYLVAGITVIVISMLQQEWIGLAIGGYFSAMGVFAFGCAAGNCTGGACSPTEAETRNRL